MKLRIFGKSHRVGTAKSTGKPYDFIEVHYSSPARFVDGQAAKTKTYDPSLLAYEAIIVPGDYEVEFDGDGAIISIAPAKP